MGVSAFLGTIHQIVHTDKQTNGGDNMPRMPKYLKEEWVFFLDSRGRKAYNDICRKCERSCKQSFRAKIVQCPIYQSKRRIDK